MIKLNKKNEEKMNKVCTFSPKLISNRNNERYLKKLIDKLFINNIMDNLNNKMANNNQMNNNQLDDSFNKGNQLDIVLEENRKNNNFNFMSRLNEYEKIKNNNLEKIKNDIYINENQKYLDNIYYNNNDKYNIEDYHLLNSTYSFFSNKKRNIEKLTKNLFDEQGITFKPKLNNEYNQKIIRNHNLLNNNEALLNKKNQKIFDYLSNKDKECTFMPKINNINDADDNNDLNVSERLFRYQNKYKEKLDLMKQNYYNFPFKPIISKNTNNILNKRKLIQNLKEQIKSNISDSNRELFLKKNEEEKIYKIPKNKNNILENCNQNNINNKNEDLNFMLDTASNNMEQQENINQNNNKNLENNNNINNDYYNNYCNNDFQVYFSNNEKNKDNDNNDIKNNKKIMNFDYYNNILN